jgi:hypothetical protein
VAKDKGLELLVNTACTKNRLVSKKKIEAIYENMLDEVLFPYTAIDALARLVVGAVEGKLANPVIILQGKYKLLRKPSHCDKNRENMQYQLRMFNRSFNLGKYDAGSIDGKIMEVEISFHDDRRMVIDGYVDGKLCHTIKRGPGYTGHKIRLDNQEFWFEFPKLRMVLLDSTMGIALKKVEQKGVIKIGSQRLNIGKEYAGRYSFILFEKGKVYPFDEEGNLLLTVPPHGQELKRRALLRKARTEEAYKKAAGESYSERAVSYMTELWHRHLHRFGKGGRKLFVAGSAEVRTTAQGKLPFAHASNEKDSSWFNVGERYHSRTVKMSWRGQYVIFTNNEGKVINTAELGCPGMDTTRANARSAIDEAVAIWNVRKRIAYVTVNEKMYNLPRRDLMEYLKRFEGYPTAVMLHILSGKQAEFTFLVNRDGALESHPMRYSKRRHGCTQDQANQASI